MVDLKVLGERQITIDCDVLQADGGTRTASITGACVALVDAINSMIRKKTIKTNPLKQMVAAISVGIYQGNPVLDLDYKEDSKAETDMNVVMNEERGIIELQGTAEGATFNHEELAEMMALAQQGINELIEAQKAALG